MVVAEFLNMLHCTGYVRLSVGTSGYSDTFIKQILRSNLNSELQLLNLGLCFLLIHKWLCFVVSCVYLFPLSTVFILFFIFFWILLNIFAFVYDTLTRVTGFTHSKNSLLIVTLQSPVRLQCQRHLLPSLIVACSSISGVIPSIYSQSTWSAFNSVDGNW